MRQSVCCLSIKAEIPTVSCGGLRVITVTTVIAVQGLVQGRSRAGATPTACRAEV